MLRPAQLDVRAKLVASHTPGTEQVYSLLPAHTVSGIRGRCVHIFIWVFTAIVII